MKAYGKSPKFRGQIHGGDCLVCHSPDGKSPEERRAQRKRARALGRREIADQHEAA